jgi:hypothetical protein
VYWRRPGHFRYRSARSLHRIQLQPGKSSVYTLFFMGPRTRDWGFVHVGHWIDHDSYLERIKRCLSSTWRPMGS